MQLGANSFRFDESPASRDLIGKFARVVRESIQYFLAALARQNRLDPPSFIAA
jgi:hypothetical protein